MTPADVVPMRVRQELRPRPRRRPKRGTGETEFFSKLARWRIPVDYERFFFPLEFHGNGQVRQGFQPDGRVRQTQRNPELYLEVALAGFCPVERTIVHDDRYQKMLEEKLPRIEGLYRHYGFRTVLVDGLLFDAIINQSGGRQRLYEAMDAVFDPAWALALAA